MRKVYKNRNEEAVSPVIATILMVAITVVLAAVLYVMVIGMGGSSNVAVSGNWTDLAKVDSTHATLKFGTFTKDLKWTDIKITVANGTTSGTMTFDANPPTAITVTGTAFTAVATDLGANSLINVGDYITLTFPGTARGEYTVTIVDTNGNEVTMTGGTTINMG